MKTSKILAVILSAILMLTLLTANVFADETTGESADVTGEVTGESTGEVTGESTGESTGEVTGESSKDADETTAAPSETTKPTTDEHEDHEINWVDIIVSASIIVLAAIAFVICYFAIPKFREKVKKFSSDYKSELKKVTWSSKEEVRKNTITVIVIILVLVIVIALLDFIFLSGIEALSHLL